VLLYQSLVGAWPIETDRVEATVLKSVREAKVHTSWRQIEPAYEDAVLAFVHGALADPDFCASLERYIADHDLVRLGRVTSLAQVTLLLTCPGVPDLYQGDELWDLSLVDPDNRRPVDFDARRELLDQIESPSQCGGTLPRAQGLSKLWLIHRVLDHRRRHPDAYAGGYTPLTPAGPRSDHVVAFSRGDLVTVVPRLVRTLEVAGGWGTTALELPEGEWRSILTEADVHTGSAPVADLVGHLPVAVLERAR
jgi:(1->4)-alpha-D-glucan 1-alpha-D-glucosylmutase